MIDPLFITSQTNAHSYVMEQVSDSPVIKGTRNNIDAAWSEGS